MTPLEPLTPSEIFTIYVKDMLRVELAKPQQIPLIVLEMRLWEAAQFDSYIVGRNTKPLLDGLGLARNEGALEYDAIIRAAKLEYILNMEGM